VPTYSEVSKFPPIRRDMAVLVDESVSVAQLLNAIQTAQLEFVSDVGLFDVYRGKGIPDGKKSLAFLVSMQSSDSSLTDADADKAMNGVLEIVKDRFGAELR
jgi:phenylalanyl-tRNA synthetase beta chain